MTFKGLLLQKLNELGISNPNIMENINKEDTNKNRLIWELKDGVFIFDVLDKTINYLYNVENEPIKIGTLNNLDEASVIALKYLLN